MLKECAETSWYEQLGWWNYSRGDSKLGHLARQRLLRRQFLCWYRCREFQNVRISRDKLPSKETEREGSIFTSCPVKSCMHECSCLDLTCNIVQMCRRVGLSRWSIQFLSPGDTPPAVCLKLRSICLQWTPPHPSGSEFSQPRSTDSCYGA